MFLKSYSLLVSCLLYASVKAENGEDYFLRWATSGGGWVAMTAGMAFANVFHRAGIIDEGSCDFTAISSSSGGAWFATQFFYSQEFFDRLIGEDVTPESVRDFAVDWMLAYADMQDDTTTYPICNSVRPIGNFPGFGDLYDMCNILSANNGSWADFVHEMLRAASTDYGDSELVNRLADSQNRLGPLRQTDLQIKTAMAPNSRPTDDPLTMVYLSPNGSDKAFTVPLGVMYTVKDGYTDYVYQVEDSNLPLVAGVGSAPDSADSPEWENFYLYPGTDGTVLTESTPETQSRSTFQAPFRNGPTISQIASASSAAAAIFADSAPSVMMQFMSALSAAATESGNFFMRLIIDSIPGTLYSNSMLSELAVCSQWPDDCGETDGRFLDGLLADNGALAMNIGEYQKNGGDLEKTLKIFYSHNDFADSNNVNFLSYFSTTFNQGIEPGDFIWRPPTTTDALQGVSTPWRSPQVFEEFLDDAAMEEAKQPVPNTDLTTAVYTGTTIDNPSVGTKAGQRVEIFAVELNSEVPMVIVGKETTLASIEPIAEMVEGIASSQVLLDRILQFLYSN